MKYQPLDVDSLILTALKPTRYVGGEVNSSSKDLRAARVTWGLCFPETYEVGMSNVGFRLLHHVLNQRPDVACERVLMPWPDMARLMRERHVPLWAMESRAPARDFDILGFSLQFEACYTTVLEMLDLAGVPLFSAQRTERDPLVIGGGPCAYSGEPVAPFFDALVLGEGEEVVGEISDLVIAWKEGHGSRAELLDRLTRIPGVYVPAFFEPVYAADGTLAAMEPKKPGYERVRRRVIADLNDVPQPDRPIVPFMATVHDRLPIEIQRGCVRGCRFCQAGMLTRPSRQRAPGQVFDLAEKGLTATGYEEVGFLSLSAGDYGCINGLLESFFTRFAPERIAISLPSLRTETMTPLLAEQIGKVRKTGFTIAPEAATDRLRRVINKGNSEENLLKAIESTFRAGWGLIKLYFMIGLPTERDEDVAAIYDLAHKAFRISRSIYQGAQIHVSVSTFVPKPFTPFQWDPMIAPKETIRRHDLLREKFGRKNGLALKYHEANASSIEGALARGDRRVATAVLAAWRAGQVLDGWSEHFNYERWVQAFGAMEREHGVSLDFMALRERREDEALPWDRMDCGVDKRFLLEERARSRREELLPDCTSGNCNACGACDFDSIRNRLYGPELAPALSDKTASTAGASASTPLEATSGANDGGPGAALPATRAQPAPRAFGVRVRYGKLGRAIAVSHLETMTLLLRALRRSGLPVVYTQGYNPKPRVSFSQACPVGVESRAEFVDLHLAREVPLDEVREALARQLPESFPVFSAEPLAHKAPALNTSISANVFLARFPQPATRESLLQRVADFQALERLEVTREKPDGRGPGKQVDLKAAILAIEVAGEREARFHLRAGNEASAKPVEVLRAVFGAAEGVGLIKEDVVLDSLTPGAGEQAAPAPARQGGE